MDKGNPKVSVIICAYTMERLNDIYEAVDSVLAQTLKPHEVILVVDHNGELYQELKDHLPSEVKILENNGDQGVSETRNVGIRAAKGEIIAFIDDDTVAEKDWLEKLTEPFQSADVIAVGGRAIPIWSNGTRPSWFPEELDWIVGCTYKGLPLKGNEIRNVPGCNMAFNRNVFNRVDFFRSDIGGVKETPRGGEEAELCLRIKNEMPDALILYKPDATIHHKVPMYRASLKYLIQRSYNEGFYKRSVEKLTSTSTRQIRSLSTEHAYLRYLLCTSIPRRSRYLHRKSNLSQVGVIVISVAATGVGYLMRNIKV